MDFFGAFCAFFSVPDLVVKHPLLVPGPPDLQIKHWEEDVREEYMIQQEERVMSGTS